MLYSSSVNHFELLRYVLRKNIGRYLTRPSELSKVLLMSQVECPGIRHLGRKTRNLVLENAVCGDLLSHNVKKSGEAQCRTQVND